MLSICPDRTNVKHTVICGLSKIDKFGYVA